MGASAPTRYWNGFAHSRRRLAARLSSVTAGLLGSLAGKGVAALLRALLGALFLGRDFCATFLSSFFRFS